MCEAAIDSGIARSGALHFVMLRGQKEFMEVRFEPNSRRGVAQKHEPEALSRSSQLGEMFFC